jgi:uncharacterized protein YjbJ (UPF0337 family)
MGLFDKAKNNAQKAGGEVKEKVGKHSDDPELAQEGREDQAKGDLKNAGEHLKDAANKVKDAFDH